MENTRNASNPEQNTRSSQTMRGTAGGKDYNVRSGNKGHNPPGSREPAIYFEFFDDGHTLNYGSYAAQGVFKTESFVYETLTKSGVVDPEPKMVAWFVRKILTVTSQLQKYFIYNNQREADNMAGSYSQILYIIYDVIKGKYPLPLDSSQVDDWYAALGKEVQIRLCTVLSIIHGTNAPQRQTPGQQDSPDSSKSTVGQPEEGSHPNSKSEEASPSVPENNRSRPSLADNGQGYSQDGPKYAPDNTSGHEAGALSGMVKNAGVPSQNLGSDSGEVPVFEQVDISSMQEDERAGEPEVEEAREFCEENDFTSNNGGLEKFGDLIEFTFGVRQIPEAPREQFLDFMDHYRSLDEMQLDAVFNFVKLRKELSG